MGSAGSPNGVDRGFLITGLWVLFKVMSYFGCGAFNDAGLIVTGSGHHGRRGDPATDRGRPTLGIG